MNSSIQHHLSLQDGVISRRQALEAGLLPHDVRRLLRRREWVVIHPGVYVAHTGPPTWHQRAWAGVLLAWPAALWGDTALRAADGPGSREHDETVVHVAVDRHRSVLVTPDDVTVHHVVDLEGRALWNLTPPRMRYEEAALDMALETVSEVACIAALAKACTTRRTTALRLRAVLGERARVPNRCWVDAVLRDIADGTCSVLEHGYLVRVERAHGLVTARRQVRATSSVGVVYRDAQYGEECIVELDGRLVHDSVLQRDADFERDLDAAVDGHSTVRLSWGQVFDRPCTTTAKLVRVLAAHGVLLAPHGCAPGCPVAALGRVA